MTAPATVSVSIEETLLQSIGENLLELDSGFDADGDLFEAGLNSMAIMQLLLAIEEKFGVFVSLADLTRENFASARSIAALIREKNAESAADHEGD